MSKYSLLNKSIKMVNPKILKMILVCFFIVASTSALIAQEIERQASVNNFNGVSVSSGIDLYLTQSSTEKVVLKGKKDLLDQIKVTKDKNGVLVFEVEKNGGWSNWSWGNDSAVKAYVSFKTLNNLIASGGSDVFSTNQFNLSTLNIKSSGGSDVKLDLNVNDLKVATSGGSDISLKGKAEKFSISASGGSDVNAFNLEAGDVVASTSGGSDAQLNATKTISISASGGSDVTYKGTAVKKSISSTGASDVTRIK